MGHSADGNTIEALLRGCDAVYTPAELATRLALGRPLRVKLGMDPTAPDLTLGHTVVLGKLRQFQDIGHKAVLIIGDYTASIGDPTGRSKTRPMLSKDEIDTNAQTYLDQAGKVLDLSEDKLEVRHNSEWLAGLSCADVIKLMSQMTVARMLERDTFAVRQAAGKEIYLHELLYPIMQAYDSVAVEADVELGGTDQTFNNLCGRDFQRNAGQPPQIVMIMPLLVGTDGKDKMSKSQGNYIAVTDTPTDMFGKVMRIPDELMRMYFELVTDVADDEIKVLTDPSGGNPRDSKETLAKTIVTRFHSVEAADAAAAEFRRVYGGGGGLPDDIPEFQVDAESKAITDDGSKGDLFDITRVVVDCGFASSASEARRLISQRGIRLNEDVILDARQGVEIKTGDVLRRGKRRCVRLRLP
ncbi:MAG: tyrosine--tRNA ligase [Planctomycetes bacterium]|nr:tyrosine--tRNA ligase [Planctomycetota bacterium]